MSIEDTSKSIIPTDAILHLICRHGGNYTVAPTDLKDVHRFIHENHDYSKYSLSDGKTYKFLGSQWAQLLPSGKTGLFAKKKIGAELDKLTGRNIEKEIKKKEKKSKELNPSSENFNNKNIPDVYKPKEGIGFFGYIFLLIIISFSFVGIIKTFENDLIEYYPELEYTFILVDEQLQFLAETVKNIITIVKDLISSY